MRRRFVLSLITLFVATAGFAQLKPEPCDSRPADRDAIHAHIGSIFQAFIDHDGAKLRETHAPAWRGYLEGSQTVIRDVDGYMKSVGNAATPGPNGMKSYKWVEFDCMFYGDTATVPFIADVDGTWDGTPWHSQLRIVDFYVKLNGHWIQAGSDTQASPKELQARQSRSGSLPESAKKSLLDSREKVWRAYFANDRTYLEQALPPELVTIDPGGDGFGSRSSILEGAARFAQSGSKLAKIDFPKTEIQNYGNVVLVYSTYTLDFDSPKGKSHESGRASESFVFQDGKWLNVGWHLSADEQKAGESAKK